MKESASVLALLSMTVGVAAFAQEATIRVDARETLHAISRYLTGACIEDVNHEIYGGLYSQMVYGESFQEPASPEFDGVSGMWRPFLCSHACGHFEIETERPFLGTQSQRIVYEAGFGCCGIENRGLNRWGMNFVAGRLYEGCLWARSEHACALDVSLQDADGSLTYAQASLNLPGGDWTRLEFSLTPNATDRTGRFAILLNHPGSVAIGYAFLQPGAWGRFKDLPVRKDVAEGMIAQGLTVLRYGGSMVNAPEYRWKKMIGPRDRRPPYKGTWYPYASNGWGIVDFVAYCEAAGFLAVPAFNMDETPEDMADFIEYMNGPADSAWGRRRAEDGHPEPYRLKHVELGNEEKVNEDYWRRFKPMAEAIWAKDPNAIVVVGDFAYDKRIEDPFRFEGSPAITSLATHQEILKWAKAHDRPVWFDVHVWNHEPQQPDLTGVRSFIEALGKLGDGADYKVCIFEENANNHAVRRAIGHAHAINQVERLGDRVPILCAANGLQPYRQNDNGWDQGMLFLTPSQVWGQPSYYVTQMIARNYLPKCIKAKCNGAEGALDVTAKASDDLRRLALHVVNVTDLAITAQIALGGFVPTKPMARVSELTGALDDVNTPEQPERIAPREREWTHALKNGSASYTFSPYSFTIMVFE